MLTLRLTQYALIRKSFLDLRFFKGVQCVFVSKDLLRHDDRCFSPKSGRGTFASSSSEKKLASEKFNFKTFVKKKVEIVERENIWTIPNLLCIARIAFTPYLGSLIFSGNFNLAFYVMIFVGLTDVLDGFIARTFTSQSSKFGTFLDPLADKILITTTCVTLTCVNLIPVPLTALILSRDIALIAAGFYIRYKSLPPPRTFVRYFDASYATAKLEPTKISKFNSSVQLAAIGISLMSPVLGFNGHPFLQYLWCFTAVTTIASGVSYVYEIDKYRFNVDKKESKK